MISPSGFAIFYQQLNNTVHSETPWSDWLINWPMWAWKLVGQMKMAACVINNVIVVKKLKNAECSRCTGSSTHTLYPYSRTKSILSPVSGSERTDNWRIHSPPGKLDPLREVEANAGSTVHYLDVAGNFHNHNHKMIFMLSKVRNHNALFTMITM